MANLPDGEVFVAGREKARVVRLLQIADELKIDQRLVRTASGGYVVPAKVADQYEKEVADAAKPVAKATSTPKATANAPAKTARTTKKSTSD